ncbi:MAG TPA: hypothetical protein VG895_00235 [Patescibacteria group bacterium]|nr:hypothetical protein [Gammaproteobacteria bacterium]HWA51470.1 hypothetical protein [Patescibacteria group bacterium]
MQRVREKIKLGVALTFPLGAILVITGSMAMRNHPQLGETNKLSAGLEIAAGGVMLCLAFCGIKIIRATRPAGIQHLVIDPPTSVATPSDNGIENIPLDAKEDFSIGTNETAIEHPDEDCILVDLQDLKETKARSRQNSISFFVPPTDEKPVAINSNIEQNQYEIISHIANSDPLSNSPTMV